MSKPTEHVTLSSMFEEDAGGWWAARCECGWVGHHCPNIEDAVDDFTDHLHALWMHDLEAAESLLRKAAQVVEAVEDIAGEGVTLEHDRYDADDAIVFRKLARASLNALTPEDREALKGWAQ